MILWYLNNGESNGKDFLIWGYYGTELPSKLLEGGYIAAYGSTLGEGSGALGFRI